MKDSRYRPSAVEIQENRIRSFLERYRFNWLSKTSEVREVATPYSMPVTNAIVYPVAHECPFLEDLYKPISIAQNGEWPDHLPISYLMGMFHRGKQSAIDEFNEIKEILSAELWNDDIQTIKNNTYNAMWQDGPATLELQSWPKELNRDSYKPGCWVGDETSRESVHINIRTGLSLHISEEESLILNSAQRLDFPAFSTPFSWKEDQPTYGFGNRRSYRRKTASYSRQVPMSGRSHHLRFHQESRALFHVRENDLCIYDIDEFSSIKLTRTTHSMGPSSSLQIEMNQGAPIYLVNCKNPDGLTEFSNELAGTIKCDLDTRNITTYTR